MFVTSLKKIVNGQNLDAKKERKKVVVLGLSASFYELNRTSRFFPGPAVPICSLVLTYGKHRSKKNDERKLESQKDHRRALRSGGFEGRNGWTAEDAQQARGSVEIRAAHGASRRLRGKSKRVQGEVSHTREKKYSSEICVLLGAISQQKRQNDEN